MCIIIFTIDDCLSAVEHRMSSPNHPQTNGVDERTNQTLLHTPTKLTTSHDEWDEFLDAALYAYRISVQDSTRFSTFCSIIAIHKRPSIMNCKQL